MDAFVHDLLRLQPLLRTYAHSLARRSRDSVEADDLFQETYLKALACQHLFHPEAPGSSLGKWTFVIMRNSFLARLRKIRNSPVVSGEEYDSACTHAIVAGGQEVSVEVAEVLDRMDLLTITHHNRMDLVRLIALGDSMKEISEHTGVPVNTVKTRLFRGRAQLRQ